MEKIFIKPFESRLDSLKDKFPNGKWYIIKDTGDRHIEAEFIHGIQMNYFKYLWPDGKWRSYCCEHDENGNVTEHAYYDDRNIAELVCRICRVSVSNPENLQAVEV